MNSLSLSVEDINYRYGARQALQSITFNIEAGSFTGLLGPNGAGKTTLFALLTRLLSSPTGQIHVLGHSLQQHPTRALQQMGVVFQQSTLDLDLTIKQNLLYHASLHGISSKTALLDIARLLKQFQLVDRISDKVRTLNQGHRRRVEVVRALLHKPRLLLFDEATVGLDVESRHLINEYVRKLCSNHGVSVLWATHMVEDIMPDDHLLLLHQGKLLGDDLCSEVMHQQQADSLKQLMLNIGGKAA